MLIKMKCFQAQFNLPLKKVFWNKGKARLQFCCYSKGTGNVVPFIWRCLEHNRETNGWCFLDRWPLKVHTRPTGHLFLFPWLAYRFMGLACLYRALNHNSDKYICSDKYIPDIPWLKIFFQMKINMFRRINMEDKAKTSNLWIKIYYFSKRSRHQFLNAPCTSSKGK